MVNEIYFPTGEEYKLKKHRELVEFYKKIFLACGYNYFHYGVSGETDRGVYHYGLRDNFSKELDEINKKYPTHTVQSVGIGTSPREQGFYYKLSPEFVEWAFSIEN